MGPRPEFFKNLKPDEKVVLIVRRHWFVLFRELAVLVILFFLPFFVLPLFLGIATQGGSVDIPSGVGFFFAALWSLILWNLLFTRWTDYYYDMWIITSQRIIDVHQNGLFYRDMATLFNLSHIEDVKTTLTGIIGNILGFGQIQVQTAGSKDEFVMNDIANPVQVEHTIRDTQTKYVQHHNYLTH